MRSAVEELDALTRVSPAKFTPVLFGDEAIRNAQGEQARRVFDERDALREQQNRSVKVPTQQKLFVTPKAGLNVPMFDGGFYPQEGMEVNASDNWTIRRIGEGSLDWRVVEAKSGDAQAAGSPVGASGGEPGQEGGQAPIGDPPPTPSPGDTPSTPEPAPEPAE